jgi:hypothetical protein
VPELTAAVLKRSASIPEPALFLFPTRVKDWYTPEELNFGDDPGRPEYHGWLRQYADGHWSRFRKNWTVPATTRKFRWR